MTTPDFQQRNRTRKHQPLTAQSAGRVAQRTGLGRRHVGCHGWFVQPCKRILGIGASPLVHLTLGLTALGSRIPLGEPSGGKSPGYAAFPARMARPERAWRGEPRDLLHEGWSIPFPARCTVTSGGGTTRPRGQWKRLEMVQSAAVCWSASGVARNGLHDSDGPGRKLPLRVHALPGRASHPANRDDNTFRNRRSPRQFAPQRERALLGSG